MSDSVWPHRRQPTRLPRPWDSPGKNTGVGCHFLLQCIKGKRESEVAQSCPTLSNPMDCSPPGSSIHGIQARVLEWGATAFSSFSATLSIYPTSPFPNSTDLEWLKRLEVRSEPWRAPTLTSGGSERRQCLRICGRQWSRKLGWGGGVCWQSQYKRSQVKENFKRNSLFPKTKW